MKKRTFAVIGLGKFGSAFAETLASLKCDVVAIDSDSDKVQALADKVTLAMHLDAMDPEALKDAGLGNVDIAVVSIGEDIEASVLVVMLLQDIGVPYIVAKAATSLHGRVLTRLGVQKVIHPEQDMARRTAKSIVKTDLMESIELSAHFSIVELPMPQAVLGKTLKDANLRAAYGLNVIAIKSRDAAHAEALRINPGPDYILTAEDIVVVIGRNEDIERFKDTTGR